MDLVDLEIKRTEHRAAEEGISPSMVAQKALDAASGAVQLNDRCVCACSNQTWPNSQVSTCKRVRTSSKLGYQTLL